MAKTSKKETSEKRSVEQNNPFANLNAVPTMPYYCTWIPGACPANNLHQAKVSPPVYPPACIVHPTNALVIGAWITQIHACGNIPTVQTTEEVIVKKTRSENPPPKKTKVTKKTIAKKPTEKKTGIKEDLKLIEGIGPKIEQLLNKAEIYTWLALSKTPVKVLRQILADAGNRYAIHDPGTWARQARMAAAGKMEALKTWQKELKGGK